MWHQIDLYHNLYLSVSLFGTFIYYWKTRFLMSYLGLLVVSLLLAYTLTVIVNRQDLKTRHIWKIYSYVKRKSSKSAYFLWNHLRSFYKWLRA